jgi:hypothetical protein
MRDRDTVLLRATLPPRPMGAELFTTTMTALFTPHLRGNVGLGDPGLSRQLLVDVCVFFSRTFFACFPYFLVVYMSTKGVNQLTETISYSDYLIF